MSHPADCHEPQPEPETVRGLAVGRNRFPGRKRVVSGWNFRITSGGDEGAPEVYALLGVLHVDVHLDVGSRDVDSLHATPPVYGFWAESCAGRVNLVRQRGQS